MWRKLSKLLHWNPVANQLTLNATLAYDDGVTEVATQVTDLIASLSDARAVKNIQLIPTSQTAINLGGITTPRWIIIVNLDSTNFVDVKVATGGAIFAHLLPGWFCVVPLGSGAQAPFAIADTASCNVLVQVSPA